MMSGPVDTHNPGAVGAAVERVYWELFPDGDRGFVARALGWTIECFEGRYADYQAVDARYHDLEHTLQGVLCLARLLAGRHRAGALPVLPRGLFELALLAMFLHDTGYLKKRDDRQGTGAKYTLTHVQRSAEFAGRFMAEQGFAPTDIQAVQNMIRCTGVQAPLTTLRFQSEAEKTAGHALATADLLGQMAAADYVDKLPALFAEFAEAAAFSGDRTSFVASFSSAEDLLRRTPEFWETLVKPRLRHELGGLYRFLNDPYPDGPNEYLERIEANMTRLRQQLATAGSSLETPDRPPAKPS